MKRSIISKYDQLKERLTGYVALLNYRYMNLCTSVSWYSPNTKKT